MRDELMREDFLFVEVLLAQPVAVREKLLEDLKCGWSAQFILELLRRLELIEMPYAEYLRTPEWKMNAANARMAYGGRCALNPQHRAEHVHHVSYRRRG